MDAKEIQLTRFQKIKPILKAINEEIPWQIVLVSILAVASAVIVPTAVPAFFINGTLQFFVVRCLFGLLVGIITFFLLGILIMLLEEKILPMISRIKKHYFKYELIAKKEVLDNVIEDEILKK